MTNFSDENLYNILGLSNSATSEEIKIAYRKLMRIHHPDVNKSKENLEIFKKIQHAYEILSNENKKKLYDIKNNFNYKTQENTTPTPKKEKCNEQTSKNNKNTKKATSILKNFFDNIFKLTKEKKQSKKDNIYANVTISSKEAILGTSRIINIVQTKICPNCEGKKFINEALCPLCKGSGEISNHKKINVKIPAGVSNGEKIKINSAGTITDNNKTNDLILIISIEEKNKFTYKNDDVFLDLPITPFEAALGTNIEIPTIYENVTLKIPKNSSSGQKLRLKGQGILNKTTNTKGDMIVTLIIKIPQNLSDKEIELYKSLRENNTCNIREGLDNND